MSALDPRLVRRARPVRRLLALDAALGVAAALLVLAQAALLARVAARGFAGVPLAELTLPLVLLVAASAGRALLSWGSKYGSIHESESTRNCGFHSSGVPCFFFSV